MKSLVIAVCLLTGASFAQTYSANSDPQLAGYLEEALANNPAIQQSFADYRAALQRIPQVTALPEPMLNFTQLARSVETRVGPQTSVLSLSQRFPWFGKLDEHGKIAAKDAAYRAQLHEARKADVVRRVKLAYYDLAYLDRAIRTTEEDKDLLGHFERLAQSRYTQGVGLQQAVVKLQAEITRDENRLEILRRQRVDAEVRLNTLMNRPAVSSVPAVPVSPRPDVSLNLERLYQLGEEQSPETKAAYLQVEKQEKRIHAARKDYWPDFTVGVGFINVAGRGDAAGRLMPPPDNGKNAYSVSVGVSIPIWRRKYDAEVLETTESLLASKEGYRQARNELQAAVRSVAFRIETVENQLALFERTLLPQAQQALRSTEAAYSTGELGVLELLDSERVMLDVQLGLAQLNSEYMKSLAEMERAIGAAFPEVKP